MSRLPLSLKEALDTFQIHFEQRDLLRVQNLEPVVVDDTFRQGIELAFDKHGLVKPRFDTDFFVLPVLKEVFESIGYQILRETVLSFAQNKIKHDFLIGTPSSAQLTIIFIQGRLLEDVLCEALIKMLSLVSVEQKRLHALLTDGHEWHFCTLEGHYMSLHPNRLFIYDVEILAAAMRFFLQEEFVY